MLGCGGAQFIFCSARDTRLDGLFQVSIEPFVGIEFRRVTWQVKDFDRLSMLAQPLPDRLRGMHAEVIEHQKDLACGVWGGRYS